MDIVKSDVVSLHGAVLSKQGGRPENQDDFGYLDTPLGFLFIVCDGMGGGPGGKMASYIAKCEICKTLLECNPQIPRETALKMAVSRAHEALVAKMEENPSLSGMGSTFVAVLANQQSAIIAHTGDSRCYLFRGKRCLYRSNDHSLVAELVRKKVMTEEQARHSPQSNVITRGLGSTKNQVPEIDEIPYRKGDRFVLCTDGVWGIMPEKELLGRLTMKSDVQPIVSNLSIAIDKIGFLQGGHHDNHTLAIFEMESSSVMKPQRNWRQIGLWGAVTLVVLCLLSLCIWMAIRTISIDDDDDSSNKKSSNLSWLFTERTSGVSESSSSKFTSKYEQLSDNSNEQNSEGENKTNPIESKSRDSLLIDVKDKLAAKLREKDSMNSSEISNNDSKTSSLAQLSNLIQDIVDKFGEAMNVAEPNVQDAAEKLETISQKIKLLLNDLGKKTKESESHSTVESIASEVEEHPLSKYVDENPIRDTNPKKYGLTSSAKTKIDKLITKLNEMKTKFQH